MAGVTAGSGNTAPKNKALPTAADKALENKLSKASLILSPREARALYALRKRPHMREEIDHVTGASNGPDAIYRLRKKGYDIDTTMLDLVDKFGDPTRAGRYTLIAEPQPESEGVK